MDQTCKKCGSQLNKNASFCGSCGTPSEKKCPKCGNEQSPNSVFCGKCGINLSAPRTATENNPPLNQATSTKNLGPSKRKPLLGLLFITGVISITLAIASVVINLQIYFDFEKDPFDYLFALVFLLWWLSAAVTIGFAVLFFFIRIRNMKASKASILAILLSLVLVGSCVGNITLLASKSEVDSNTRVEKYSDDIRLNPNDHNAYRLRAGSHPWTDEGHLLAIDDYTQAINIAENIENDLPDVKYLSDLHLARADKYRHLINCCDDSHLGAWSAHIDYEEDSVPSSDRDKEMYQLAIDDYTTAISIITSDNVNVSAHKMERIYVERGDLHARMGAYELAIEDYNHSSISSDNTYLLHKKARIYIKLGKDDLAVEVIDEYVKNDPENPEVYCERGWFYDDMNMPEQKQMNFDKASELWGFRDRC